MTGNGILKIWNVGSMGRVLPLAATTGLNTRLTCTSELPSFGSERVHAIRLDTGRVVTLARVPARRARVQIEAPGVVYQYNADGRGFMRFIRMPAVERALDRR